MGHFRGRDDRWDRDGMVVMGSQRQEDNGVQRCKTSNAKVRMRKRWR